MILFLSDNRIDQEESMQAQAIKGIFERFLSD